MDIDTSTISAARRNLVVISIGFILFTLGEASLGDGTGKTTLTIFSSNITFNNPNILIKFTWILFGWFLLRFWQFSNPKAEWITYTTAMYTSELMKNWYKKNNLTGHSSYSGNAYQPVFGDWRWPASGNQNLTITKLQLLKKLFIFTYIALKTEHFGQFYFPYCLSTFALWVTLCT